MQELTIGMIGLDTSHCEAFTEILNNAANPHHVPGAKVVRAFRGGSPAFSKSIQRIDGFTRTLREKYDVALVDSLEELARTSDAFLLNSVDGRQHLEQFRAIAPLGKPVFIDKPLACSYADARQIAELSRRHGTPVMTASAIRFAKGLADLCPAGAAVQSCEAFGPAEILPDYPGYFWYGIHSAETLFSYMGRGCRRVQVVSAGNADLLVGTWSDGRIGTVRGTRFQPGAFGCELFTTAGVRFGMPAEDPPYYVMMLRQVVPFLQGGQSPIALEESLEIIAFLEAAWESRSRGGQAVDLPR